MKRLWLCLMLVACPGEDPGPVPVPLPPQAVARLVTKEGTVNLERSGARSVAEPGALLENDVLETLPSSTALLRAPGGREIELGESTRFKVGTRPIWKPAVPRPLRGPATHGPATGARRPHGRSGRQGRVLFEQQAPRRFQGVPKEKP